VKIFIPKETVTGETRVAATPVTVKALIKVGLEVLVEQGAGKGSLIEDKDFEKEGGKIISNIEQAYQSADIVLAVNPPQKLENLNQHQIDLLSENSTWISMFTPSLELETIKKMRDKKINGFSLNLMPRITRAQKMDTLTSQSNLAGYKAVIMAAEKLTKIFPLMMTAAGTINPVKVVILGAGVAGLQAIATAKRLGAQVEVSDIRPAVKEQVESLGGKFIDVPLEEDTEDEKGYAKGPSKEFLKKQAEEVAKRVALADVVITTALIPGRKAPILITEEMVNSMIKGSVIVDMAACMGGNCALTKAGETIEVKGITIIGETNLNARLAVSSTSVYAKNIYNFLMEIIKDKELNLNLEDEVIKECLVISKGKILHKNIIDLIS